MRHLLEITKNYLNKKIVFVKRFSCIRLFRPACCRLLFMVVAVAALASCSKVRPDGSVVTLAGGEHYAGTVDAQGRPHGYGELAKGDSVLYEGQWNHGVRSGRGTVTDSTGTPVTGTWSADTLSHGTRSDGSSTYTGYFSRRLSPEGYGSLRDSTGAFYAGQWCGGKRTGWGFALSPKKHIRVGEWKADRYLGERLSYTADRIYGIDISRFQHDVGRKRYAIRWDRLRISHLGTISRKTVQGKVDYPVSFMYIKSTEGRTLRNRYFASDYAAARRHGIRVGAYHFFSPNSSGAAQAEFFLRYSRFSKGDLPPVLDLEPSHKQVAKMGGAAAMFRMVRAWMQIVERRTGTKPVLYISQTFVNRYLPEAPDLKKNYNIWIARYGEYKPDVHLVYWQLCPDGRVSGITPKVDINVFNGYRGEFNDFLQKNCIKR